VGGAGADDARENDVKAEPDVTDYLVVEGLEKRFTAHGRAAFNHEKPGGRQTLGRGLRTLRNF
jgi:hypothetical protein